MFNQLSDRFSQLVHKMRGYGVLTEDNIQEALADVRPALIEADVALEVIEPFLQHVREKAIGQTVVHHINPGQAFIKIVHEELTHLMGEKNNEINLNAQPPVVILMAGLQGSGKTTSTAKLARLLKTQLRKKVMVTSVDIYRPAAIEQLKTLAEQVDVTFFQGHGSVIQMAEEALSAAKNQVMDVLIVDTAGRLAIDETMMTEIKSLHQTLNPPEVLLVVDSMTGQDAARTAKAFHDALSLTGVILTKADGDARGGAALSVRQLTGKPIKLIGTGEKIDAFEFFHPERIASRILDMGDILSLVEEAERKIDKTKAESLTKKLRTGKAFDFNDFLEQINQMENMGGIMGLMSKLPGVNAIPQAMKNQVNDQIFQKMKIIIQSMTKKERRFPHLIGTSAKRRVRIAAGSGTKVQDVNHLLKQFDQMQKMMKKMAKPGAMKNLMRQIPQQFMM